VHPSPTGERFEREVWRRARPQRDTGAGVILRSLFASTGITTLAFSSAEPFLGSNRLADE
jgi:hypothetical protein